MMSSALGYAVAPRVARVDVVEPYRLAVAFLDGSEQSIDLEPLTQTKSFGRLRDPAQFKQVVIDSHGSLVWPNHAMLPVWTLHDWPAAGASFIAQVQKRERGERRLRIVQTWFTATTALWFLGYVASWAGWLGGEPAAVRDLTLPGSMVTLTASQLVRPHRIAWAFVLLFASVAFLAANFALR